MSLRGELLSVRVKEVLLEQLRAGRWKPGDQLPAESDLADVLGVSRLTLRSGLIALERDGILMRKQGQGTFVAKNRQMVKTRIDDLLPVPELIRTNGFTASMEALTQRWAPIPRAAAEMLGLAPETLVLEVRRVYLADETPAVLVIDYLPEALLAGMPTLDGFQGNMIAFMDEHLRIRCDHAVAMVRAEAASAEVRSALRLRRDDPVLVIDQLACDERGGGLWFSHGYHRSDCISFQAVRKRR